MHGWVTKAQRLYDEYAFQYVGRNRRARVSTRYAKNTKIPLASMCQGKGNTELNV